MIYISLFLCVRALSYVVTQNGADYTIMIIIFIFLSLHNVTVTATFQGTSLLLHIHKLIPTPPGWIRQWQQSYK